MLTGREALVGFMGAWLVIIVVALGCHGVTRLWHEYKRWRALRKRERLDWR